MDGRSQIRHGVGEENKRKREKERESHVWLVSTSWWKEISNCIDACRREWEKDTPTIYLYVGGGNTRGFPPKKEYLFFYSTGFLFDDEQIWGWKLVENGSYPSSYR